MLQLQPPPQQGHGQPNPVVAVKSKGPGGTDSWIWAPWWPVNAESQPSCQSNGGSCFFFAATKGGYCQNCGDYTDIRRDDPRYCCRCWEVKGGADLDGLHAGMCRRHHDVERVRMWRQTNANPTSLPAPPLWTLGPEPPPGMPMPQWFRPRGRPNPLPPPGLSDSTASTWLATPSKPTGAGTATGWSAAAAAAAPSDSDVAEERVQQMLVSIVSRLNRLEAMLQEVLTRQDQLARDVRALQQQQARSDLQSTSQSQSGWVRETPAWQSSQSGWGQEAPEWQQSRWQWR